MNVVNKFVSLMSMGGADEEEYDDGYEQEDDYLDDDSYEANEYSLDQNEAVRGSKRYANNKVSSMKSKRVANVSTGNNLEVCVIKPKSMDAARTVTETLLQNRAVVLNLEGLEVDMAQRIIDFTSGSCYAIAGNLQKISNYIFIITPKMVDISGDFLDVFGGANSEVPTI